MELDTIGKRINFARIILGLSQRGLADMLGLSQSSVISNWERGRNKPIARSVPNLAETLNCTAAWLFFGVGDRPV